MKIKKGIGKKKKNNNNRFIFYSSQNDENWHSQNDEKYCYLHKKHIRIIDLTDYYLCKDSGPIKNGCEKNNCVYHNVMQAAVSLAVIYGHIPKVSKVNYKAMAQALHGAIDYTQPPNLR